MENGRSAATGMSGMSGMSGNEVMRSTPHRRFLIRLAAEGDAAALEYVEQALAAQSKKRSDSQVASMGQDMRKGRRTEIEFMNGHVVATARSIGRDAPASQALLEIVRSIEHGAARPDPSHITGLRLPPVVG
jgi:2-dehydropantoate 2-reductase